jgi:hypothetical protein
MVVFIIAAAIGLTVFGVLTWRAVDVQHVDSTDAPQLFEEALAHVDSGTPLVTMDASGRFVRRASSGRGGARPEQLHVPAYRANEQRLLRADVPMWFFRVKGPAVQYALRGTGFDLEALGLSASDLEQFGVGVVLDETNASGDRLLAWTQ